MAKSKKESKPSEGEQLDLIDVAPKNSKEIVQVARNYKKLQAKRIEILDREVAEKQKLLDLIKDANLQRLEDGKIRFRIDGMIITVTPRDELVKIKEENVSEL